MSRFNLLNAKPISAMGLSAVVEKRALAGEAVESVTDTDVDVLRKSADVRDGQATCPAVDTTSPRQEVSVQEAAGMLGLSSAFVTNLTRKKVLPHSLVGTQQLIPVDAILEYKNAQAQQGGRALDGLFRVTEDLGH